MSNSQPFFNADDYVTVEQLAKILVVPKQSIYQWSFKGKIPCYKIGRSLRFKKVEIVQWLESKHRGISA